MARISNKFIKPGVDAVKIGDGSVENAEFQALDGVTGSIQSQLNNKIETSEKGAANGVATLGADSKIPSAQIPAIALTEVYVVADITARDSLTVQEGDVAKVTDASADPSVTNGSASYIYDGSSWIRLNVQDQVLSVNGQTGSVSLDTDDISEGSINLYYTEARVIANTDVSANTAARHAAVTLNGDDATQQTLNLSTQELQVNLATSGTDGAMSAEDKSKLDGIEANAKDDQNASEVPYSNVTSGLTATDTQAAIDEVDVRVDNLETSSPEKSAGDLNELSFSLNNNQTTVADVTGLSFANGTVRSAEIHYSVVIDATSNVYETGTIIVIQQGASWVLMQNNLGDNSGISFDITPTGQVQYTSDNTVGFVSGILKARAITTSV